MCVLPPPPFFWGGGALQYSDGSTVYAHHCAFVGPCFLSALLSQNMSHPFIDIRLRVRKMYCFAFAF